MSKDFNKEIKYHTIALVLYNYVNLTLSKVENNDSLGVIVTFNTWIKNLGRSVFLGLVMCLLFERQTYTKDWESVKSKYG